MSAPIWGHVHDLVLPGARAAAAIALSEDDWNLRTRDAVIVPVFRAPGSAQGNVRIALDDQLVADCTRVQNVAQEYLGEDRGSCAREALRGIRLGVRIYLDIDRLLALNRRSPLKPRSEWWPRQGQVRYAEIPDPPEDKMFCIVSDDDWSSRPTTTYSGAVRLTSKTRDWRGPWEVEIPGGYLVAGHLYSLLHEDINPDPPRGERPTELSPEKLKEVAERLLVLLKIT